MITHLHFFKLLTSINYYSPLFNQSLLTTILATFNPTITHYWAILTTIRVPLRQDGSRGGSPSLAAAAETARTLGRACWLDHPDELGDWKVPSASAVKRSTVEMIKLMVKSMVKCNG